MYPISLNVKWKNNRGIGTGLAHSHLQSKAYRVDWLGQVAQIHAKWSPRYCKCWNKSKGLKMQSKWSQINRRAIKKHTRWDNRACANIGMSNTKSPTKDYARVAQTLGEQLLDCTLGHDSPVVVRHGQIWGQRPLVVRQGGRSRCTKRGGHEIVRWWWKRWFLPRFGPPWGIKPYSCLGGLSGKTQRHTMLEPEKVA